MNKSDGIANLCAALALAQGKFPHVPRTKTVTVRTEKGSYNFTYAPLDDLIARLRPTLAEYGLGFTQGADGAALVTTIFHSSGEWISHTMPLPDAQNAQQYGSQITYRRRYSLKAALGIETDEDDEGAATVAPVKEKIKPNADPWSAVPDARHESLRRIASGIMDCFSAQIPIKAHEAWAAVSDREEKLCVWSLLTSGQKRQLRELDRLALEKSIATGVPKA